MRNNDSIKSKVISGISWAFAEKWLTEIVGLIISIVLARLLIPDEYGVVAVVQVFVSLSTIFVTCGLGSALVQKKNPTENEISTVFYINLAIGCVLYLILFLVAPMVATSYKNELLCPLLRVLAIRLPIASVYNMQYTYMQKQMKFKEFFFSSLGGTIASGVVGIIMAYFGFGPWALVAASLTDQVLDSVILFLSTRWLPRFKLSVKETVGMLKYAVKILLAELVSRGYEQIRLLVIGKCYSPTDLALNSKGQKFPQMIIESTNSTIIRVMFPTLSIYQDAPEQMHVIAKKAIQVSSFILCPCMIGLAAIANHFVPIVLTDNWNQSIPFLQVYCFTYVFQPIHTMDLKIIQACGRSDIALRIELFKKGLGFVFLIVAVMVFKSALGVAISFTVMSVISLLFNAQPCKKLIGYGLGEQLFDFLPSLILSLVMGIAVYSIGYLPIGHLCGMALQVAVGVFVYVGLALVLKLKSAMYLLDLIRSRRRNK